MNVKLNQSVRRRLGFVVKCVALVAVLLMTACSENEPTPPPPPPPAKPCHPEQLPSPTINHETFLGESDGIIKNPSDYPIEVSTTREFSSGNFILQPGAAKEYLPAGDYHVRWAANGTCPADSRIVDITIEEGVTPPLPLIDIESVVPYTEGSNQEWALWALAQTPNSAEKIRFYNFLLKARTYIQIHDKNDYTAEYDEGKKLMELDLQNTTDEATKKKYELALADDNWMITCKYPVQKPFQLSFEEVIQVNNYLHEANPQLFLSRMRSFLDNSVSGQSVRLNIRAYYAYAKNRQETHKKVIDGFDAFKSEFEKAGVNINNKYDVAKYVYDDIAKTIVPGDSGQENYVPRETTESWESILGYFGDLKTSICDGYARTFAYLQNRLGIPTIYQVGISMGRDENGNITGSGGHAWNMVNMGNEEKEEWYFLDGTGATVGIYPFFLKGRGANGKSPEDYLYRREPSKDFLYPECEIEDYPRPVQDLN